MLTVALLLSLKLVTARKQSNPVGKACGVRSKAKGVKVLDHLNNVDLADTAILPYDEWVCIKGISGAEPSRAVKGRPHRLNCLWTSSCH
jgi:hypothetical protein